MASMLGWPVADALAAGGGDGAAAAAARVVAMAGIAGDASLQHAHHRCMQAHRGLPVDWLGPP